MPDHARNIMTLHTEIAEKRVRIAELETELADAWRDTARLERLTVMIWSVNGELPGLEFWGDYCDCIDVSDDDSSINGEPTQQTVLDCMRKTLDVSIDAALEADNG